MSALSSSTSSDHHKKSERGYFSKRGQEGRRGPLTKILMVVIRMKIARQHSLRNAHVLRIETDAPFRQFFTYISEPQIRVHAVHTQPSFHQS